MLVEESLERVVFGQREAVHLVAQAIKRSRAGLGQPEHGVQHHRDRDHREVEGEDMHGQPAERVEQDLSDMEIPTFIRRQMD